VQYYVHVLKNVFMKKLKNYTNEKWNKQFEYPKSMRSLINDERHYEVGTEYPKLPSVTLRVTKLLQLATRNERLLLNGKLGG
jgi:hypothetical protein